MNQAENIPSHLFQPQSNTPIQLKTLNLPFLLTILLAATLWPGSNCLLCMGAVPVFDVVKFGAVADGATMDTMAIQKALDACAANGGRVLFPPGIYLSQPLRVYSRTIIELESNAVLKATDDPRDYLPQDVEWQDVIEGKSKGPFKAFINGTDLTDVTLCGGGVIDGSGTRWWVPAEQARRIHPGYTLPRPNLVSFTRVNHLTVEGVTLENSPKFHLVPEGCRDVQVRSVTIRAPQNAANTDAIDPGDCQDVVISNCLIDVGDDDIAIKSGRRIPGVPFSSAHFLVTQCRFLHGHGMSIGSETLGGVDDVVVEDCTFQDTENGLRIKSDVNRGGLVQNVTYRHIRMENVNPAITLTCFYQNNSSGDAALASQTMKKAHGLHPPVYRDIHFLDIVASSPKKAGILAGLPSDCISNVDFTRVRLSARTGLEIENVMGVNFKETSIHADSGPAIIPKNAGITGIVTDDLN